MPRIDASVRINAPVEKVFSYVASPENGPVFIPNLNENSDISVTPTRIGQKWNWRFNMVGVDLRGTAEVTGLEPLKRWALKTEGAGKSDWTYLFSPEGRETQVRLQIEYDVPRSVLGKVAGAVVERMNQKNAEDTLANLKTILEA
jgi:uncharacterized membrane protein